MRRISRQRLPDWLVSLNLLTPPINNNTRYSTLVPTPEGLQMGITQIIYTSERGTYQVNALDIEAQQFIIDNMEEFLAFKKSSKFKI